MITRSPKLLSFVRRQSSNNSGSRTLPAARSPLDGQSIATTGLHDLGDGSDDAAVRAGPLGLNTLYDPPEPLVELIFVHGLGGSSRQSWSKSSSDDHFWPQSWLPRDPSFCNVRVHSFGYISRMTEVVKAVSGIPDYAQSLLNAIRDDASIRQYKNVIILVGHSMGGLVIKKAFIQARTFEAYKDIGIRMKALYFLGTPHHGSEFISAFKSYVKGMPLLRTTENIKDMDPSSRLIEALNQDLPRCSQDIELRSFWEMQKSKIYGTYKHVVPKHSACLNYINEVSDGLDADHRGICKFDTPTDPNYQKVRNALAATVSDLVRQHDVQDQTHLLESMQQLQQFLDINEAPEDDLTDLLERCLDAESCAWFTARADFQDWRDSPSINSDSYLHGLILMEGEPGVGKSVLSAQVVHNLQALNHQCSYYFFDAQDRDKSSSGRLLRSLAFQMAVLDPQICTALLEYHKQGIAVYDEDGKHIWRTIFTNCIFNLQSARQHYWVIDALDECLQSASLLQMLLSLAPDKRPRVFMTRRSAGSISREVTKHHGQISCLRVSKSDIRASIKTYVEMRTSELILRDPQEKRELIEALLNNADGSFLWVKLTLDSMTRATGPKQIMDSLELIPKGMDSLYSRILVDLERDVLEEQKSILKAVIRWVMCANPSLTVDELSTVVKLDIGSDIFMDKMYEVLRNLILIDSSGKVRPIHQTVRTYLLQPGSSSIFTVVPSDAHARIAHVLLGHLHQRLRNIRKGSQLEFWHQRRQGVDDYALLRFSDHLLRAEANGHALLFECDKFFTSSGLTWIACIALTGSLAPIIETSQNLRHWLQAHLKRNSLRDELTLVTGRIQQWSIDLGRLAAKFGRYLLQCPSAIYGLVSSFLPLESILAVARPRPGYLTVTGLQNNEWNDRLCSKFYQDSHCAAIASGKYNFAVSMRNGKVYIYDNSTTQLLTTLDHGAVVKLMKFDEFGTSLVTAGFRKIVMWTIPEGRLLWEVPIKSGDSRLAAEFVDNGVLLTISSKHKLYKQNAADGQELDTILLTDSVTDADGIERMFRRELQYAEFSKDAEMLGTMQRERPIQLNDIENRFGLGHVELHPTRDDSYINTERPITTWTFCANTEIALLAVLYRDGTLAVFDRDLDLKSKRADTHGSTLLAGSPSGLLLATANVDGIITVYDFERLTPLHTLHTNSFENIRALVFSGDGQRIIDIRDRQANIWVPAALINGATDDFDNHSESISSPTLVNSTINDVKDATSDISCITPCPGADEFFVGRNDGIIAIYKTKNAQCICQLFRDPGRQFVTHLRWKPSSRILASLNGASTLAIHYLGLDWTVSTVFRQCFPHPVKHFFINTQNNRLKLFIVTTKNIELWARDQTEEANSTIAHKQSYQLESTGLWVEDPSGQLMLVEPNKVSKFSWDDLESPQVAHQLAFSTSVIHENTKANQSTTEGITTFDRGATLSPGGRPKLFLRSISSPNTTPVTSAAAMPTIASRRKRWMVDLSPNNDESSSKGSNPAPGTNYSLPASLLPVSHLIEHVIGIRNEGKQLLFLDKKLWICSYDLVPIGVRSPRIPGPVPSPINDTGRLPQEYSRHFFIPDDWISSNYSNENGQLLFVIAGQREDCLVFAKKHEIAVIKNPFAYSEKMSIA